MLDASACSAFTAAGAGTQGLADLVTWWSGDRSTTTFAG